MGKGMYVGRPTSYTKLSYIESHIYNRIDTGVYPNANIHCIVDFQLTSIDTSGVIGGWDASKGMLFGVHSGNFRFAFGTSAWAGNTIPADFERHTLYMNDENGDGRLDDTILASHSNVVSLVNSTHPLYLFASNGGSGNSACRIYSCKIYDGETLIRDFIPILTEAGIACMYDLVEEKYYYDSNPSQDSVGSFIPSYFGEDFERLDYIESTGTQYLNSELRISSGTTSADGYTVRGHLMLTEAPSAYVCVCGDEDVDGNWRQSNLRVSSNKAWVFAQRSSSSNVVVANKEYSINGSCKQTGHYLNVNDVSVISNSTTSYYISSKPLYIFANGNGTANPPSANQFIKMRLYWIKFADAKNVWQRYLIPVRRKSDDVICMYDLVYKRYYENQGTGDFIAGSVISDSNPEVVDSGSTAREVQDITVGTKCYYKPIEFIESTGIQWIDTKVVPNNNTKVEIEFQITGGTQPSYPGILGLQALGNSSGNNNYLITYDINGNIRSRIGNTNINSSNITVDVNTRIHAFAEAGRFVVNDVEFTGEATPIEFIDDSLYLFARYCRQDKKVLENGKGTSARLYMCKIWDGDTLIRDFIPVLDANNVICLYDKVFNTYYYNVGTGVFLRDYTPIEFIQSTGAQYINTNIVPKSTTRIVVDIANCDTVCANHNLMGWGSTGNQEAFFIGGANNNSYFQMCCSATWGTVITDVPLDLERHVFDVANEALKLDNVSYGTGNIGNTATSGQTLYLFARHVEYSPYTQYANQKLYACQIYDGETLVRDYIPVLRSDNVACLYDLVNKTYATNGGSGIFLTPYYDELEYLESTGSQYIDMSFMPNQNTGFEMDLIPYNSIATSGYGYIFSAYDGTNRYSLNTYPAFTGGEFFITTGITNAYNPYLVQNTRKQIALKNGTFVDNEGNTFTITSAEVQITKSMFLFAHNNNGSAATYSRVRFYSFKLYDGNTLIHNYIPVRSSNVICLYDKAHNCYVLNRGSGNFTAGPIVTSVAPPTPVAPTPIFNKTMASKVVAGFVGVKSTLYTPLDYLQTTGAQYIDTGVTTTPNLKIELDCEYLTGDTNTWVPLYGTRTDSSSTTKMDWLGLWIQSQSFHISPNYGIFDPGTGGNVIIAPYTRYTFTQDKGQFYINNVLQPTLSTNEILASGTRSLYLFTMYSYDGTTYNRGLNMKFYGCKIWDNNVLIRDFIPVINAQSVVCIYDKVGKTFYYNGGSGMFFRGQLGEPVIKSLARRIYGTQNINADNVGGYFNLTNGTYRFAGDGNKFENNNKGKGNTTATTTFTSYHNMQVSFKWAIGTEANYDKFTMIIKGTTILNAIGGEQSGTHTTTLAPGQQIILSYSKDSSGDANGDFARIYDIEVVLL